MGCSCELVCELMCCEMPLILYAYIHIEPHLPLVILTLPDIMSQSVAQQHPLGDLSGFQTDAEYHTVCVRDPLHTRRRTPTS
jgi:hypothetical protein